MVDDITSRTLRLFERRVEMDPEVSAMTIEVLLDEQRTANFGDDDEIITELLESIENHR